ncbi:hypothetical protein GFS60_07313 (plasmid) [Rhodococcus sp. WAY2]|nr:hypothetical protein GFS60_07313 [Rhodococcus sp. WAY2]
MPATTRSSDRAGCAPPWQLLRCLAAIADHGRVRRCRNCIGTAPAATGYGENA